MSEELRQIDDSVLASLLELRRERDALRQRLARMQEAAAEVSEKVLARVRGDYEARIAALDDKAAPLKDAARAEFGRLTPLLEKAHEACETLRLDREEIELRHKLGEYDDDQHRDKAAEVGESLRAAEAHAAAIAETVARFRGAFDAPEELAPATTSQVGIPAFAAGPAAEAAELSAPVAPSPGEPREEDGTLMLPPEPPPAPAPPPPPPASSPEPPVWSPLAAWSASTAPGAPAEEPWRAAAAALMGEAVEVSAIPASPESPEVPEILEEDFEPEIPTSHIATPPAARARLEALDGDLEPQPHFLEPLTFIGRTPENQIRIYKPAVSRRHAQITETDAGWLLRDLSSENGTYVNGQRISERLLAEGDRVQFGTSRFVLRLTS